MMKNNQRFSKLVLSLAAASLLSGAAVESARANPIPTTSDEARPLAVNATTHATPVVFPAKGDISTTDEARALAGSSLPASFTPAVLSEIVTSTDEARAVAAVGHPAPSERDRREGGRSVASNTGRDPRKTRAQ